MKNIMKAKKAVKKALEIQKNGGGFSLVEILSPCPTIMKMDPVVARKWVGETLMKAFPLGVFRDRKPELPTQRAGSTKNRCRSAGRDRGQGCRRYSRSPPSHTRVNSEDGRIRRAGHPADGPVARRDGIARADGSELAARRTDPRCDRAARIVTSRYRTSA